jgi:hypothetical protein
MHGDRIDFISAYCDRWCERCAFTNRCSAYAVKAALAMCEGDFGAAVELAVGAPPPRHEAKERTGHGELLAAYNPTEEELAAIGREMEEREERIDESPLTTDAIVMSTLAGQCLEKHRKSLEDRHDRSVREALEIASWDCHLIGAKLHRALSGQDEADYDGLIDSDPIQNDWNGSAKVALISMDRSITAWTTIAVATADADAAAMAQRLQTLRLDVERKFPNARKFVRPGFDEEGQRRSRRP